MTDRYGPPDVLRVADVEQPVAKENEVLVTVHASTVTRGDAMLVRSAEYRFARLFTGIRRPRRTSFGTEFAGTVADVGAPVTEFQAGDEVFGAKGGANAESLRQAQRNFQSFGAMSKDAISNVRKATPEDKRKRNWKPL